MSKEYRPGYKKPQSRSEEIKRYEEADRNLAIRLGEVPPPHSRLRRLAHNFYDKVVRTFPRK